MLEKYVFVVHVCWVSLPLVVGMLPPDSNDDDNISIHLVEMDTLDDTLSSCSDDDDDFCLNLDH